MGKSTISMAMFCLFFGVGNVGEARSSREARRQIWRLEKSSLAPAQAALGWDALVWRLPPGNQQFAIENGPFIVMVDLEWIYPLKIVDLPIENGDL